MCDSLQRSISAHNAHSGTRKCLESATIGEFGRTPLAAIWKLIQNFRSHCMENMQVHSGYTHYWADVYDQFLTCTNRFLNFTAPPIMCKIVNFGGKCVNDY